MELLHFCACKGEEATMQARLTLEGVFVKIEKQGFVKKQNNLQKRGRPGEGMFHIRRRNNA